MHWFWTHTFVNSSAELKNICMNELLQICKLSHGKITLQKLFRRKKIFEKTLTCFISSGILLFWTRWLLVRCFDKVNQNLYFVANKPSDWLKQITWSVSANRMVTTLCYYFVYYENKFSFTMSKHLILLEFLPSGREANSPVCSHSLPTQNFESVNWIIMNTIHDSVFY